MPTHYMCKGLWASLSSLPTNEKCQKIGLHDIQWVHSIYMEFLGKMERYISCSKNGSKYDTVPYVEINPVELGRLGRVVPRFTKSREWHEWDFCKWYRVSWSFQLKQKKRNTFEGIPSISENFHQVNCSIWHFNWKNSFSANGKRSMIYAVGQSKCFAMWYMTSEGTQLTNTPVTVSRFHFSTYCLVINSFFLGGGGGEGEFTAYLILKWIAAKFPFKIWRNCGKW